MSIRYKCAECGASMKIKDEKAGTTGHCPKCKTEFIVPAPSDAETAENEAPSAAEEKPEKRKKKEEPQVAEPQSEESLEDEYQRILMGEDSPGSGGSRKKAIDSDAFLSVDPDDDEPPPRPSRSIPSDSDYSNETPAPKSKAKTTAEISASLMRNTAEPTLKKTGKGFGESTSDKGEQRKKLDAQSRNYYLQQVAGLAVGVLIIGGGLYWIMSSMMGSAKYPPLGRVYGVVTLDGKPLPAATITFQPIADSPDANTKVGASVGISDAAGKYEMFYVKDVRGAVVGKHFIQVRAQNEVGMEAVPPKYNANSQLGTEVKAGSNEYNITLSKN